MRVARLTWVHHMSPHPITPVPVEIPPEPSEIKPVPQEFPDDRHPNEYVAPEEFPTRKKPPVEVPNMPDPDVDPADEHA